MNPGQAAKRRKASPRRPSLHATRQSANGGRWAETGVAIEEDQATTPHPPRFQLVGASRVGRAQMQASPVGCERVFGHAMVKDSSE